MVDRPPRIDLATTRLLVMYFDALARRIDAPGDHICGSGAVRRRRRRLPSAPLSGIVIAMDDHPLAMRLSAMREPGREPDHEPDAPPDVGAAAIARSEEHTSE